MLRLALIITELEPGGAERCLVNLATGLDRSRFEPAVYSLGPPPAAGKAELVERLEAANIPVRFLNLRSPWQAFSAVSQLAKLLKEQQPDVVQTFLFHANVLGTLAARRAGVPRVATGIRVADPRRWRWWIERWLTRDANRMVCVSQSVATFCREKWFPTEKLVVIPNGVDVERFRNSMPVNLASLGLPAGRRMILYVGRLDRQKGLDELLRAAAEFLPELPHRDLVLVGEGPERVRLERAAAKLPGNRIHFLGYRTDVPALLAAADLLVLPSRWEGMPNVVLEAMAAGKPVVATRAEGVLELLGEDVDQQTVAAGDIPQLAKLIIQTLQNVHLAENLGQRNQIRAQEHFSVAAMVAKYQQLYDQLAAK